MVMTANTTALVPVGEDFWHRGFDLQESITRTKTLRVKTTEMKVKLGLEIFWARLNIEHGSWYSFLMQVDIDNTTAWRRRQNATDFMSWLTGENVRDA